MPRKRTPDETPTETPTAVADAPATEAAPERPSFAARVGQKERLVIPDPFLIATDELADVRLFESKKERRLVIQFGDGGPESKPSQAVINRVRQAGFTWDKPDRLWELPVTPDSARRSRVEAERAHRDVSQMIRAEKGLDTGQEIPF